jgi:hypothetical protein
MSSTSVQPQPVNTYPTTRSSGSIVVGGSDFRVAAASMRQSEPQPRHTLTGKAVSFGEMNQSKYLNKDELGRWAGRPFDESGEISFARAGGYDENGNMRFEDGAVPAAAPVVYVNEDLMRRRRAENSIEVENNRSFESKEEALTTLNSALGAATKSIRLLMARKRFRAKGDPRTQAACLSDSYVISLSSLDSAYEAFSNISPEGMTSMFGVSQVLLNDPVIFSAICFEKVAVIAPILKMAKALSEQKHAGDYSNPKVVNLAFLKQANGSCALSLILTDRYQVRNDGEGVNKRWGYQHSAAADLLSMKQNWQSLLCLFLIVLGTVCLGILPVQNLCSISKNALVL